MEKYEPFLKLLACAVTGKPFTHTEPFDLDELFEFSSRHSVSSTVAHTVLNSDIELDDNQKQIWKEIEYKNCRKTYLYDMERASICQALDENGIWHIPLKAIIINPLYPIYGMREFADNDILIDSSAVERLEPIMESLGYKFDPVSISIHYTFKKKPMFNFELHHRLFSDQPQYELFNQFFQQRIDSMSKGAGGELNFTTEDSYLYFIAHAKRHFSEAGSGLRTLADVYLYRKKVPMDEEYLVRNMKALELAEFADSLESLSKTLFASDTEFSLFALKEDEQAMLEEMIGMGTYGTSTVGIQKRFERYTNETDSHKRLKYFKKRLFPDIEPYRKRYPTLYRHKILHPLFYVYRPINSLVKNGKNIRKEIKIVSKIKKDEKSKNPPD